jgi:hypothetical protein
VTDEHPRLFLFRLFKSFLEGLVVKDELQLRRGVFCSFGFPFAIVAAECDFRTGDFDASRLIKIPATEGTTLLLVLLGGDKLMIGLGGKFLGVLGEFAGASVAAEKHFRIFVLGGFADVGGLVGNHAFDILQIDIRAGRRGCRDDQHRRRRG